MDGSCKECGEGGLPAVPSSAAVLAAAALSRGCIAALKFHNKTCSPVSPVLVANQSRLAGYCLNMLRRKLPLKRQLKLLWTALPALLVLSIIVLSGPSPLFSATFPLAPAVPAPSRSPSPDSPPAVGFEISRTQGITTAVLRVPALMQISATCPARIHKKQLPPPTPPHASSSLTYEPLAATPSVEFS